MGCLSYSEKRMATKNRAVVRSEIDLFRCIGCGVCVQSCQNDVLRMKRGKAKVVYPEDCSGCCCCVEDCPREAASLRLRV